MAARLENRSWLRPPWLRPRDERDPANALYDHASELLTAARSLREWSAEPQSALAIAACLGCIEQALAEIADTSTSMGDVVGLDHGAEAVVAVHRLGRNLEAARASCAEARELVGAPISRR